MLGEVNCRSVKVCSAGAVLARRTSGHRQCLS